MKKQKRKTLPKLCIWGEGEGTPKNSLTRINQSAHRKKG